eukprot:scaffold195348_cov36-Prasinocladus_malaysianus.AAC.2
MDEREQGRVYDLRVRGQVLHCVSLRAVLLAVLEVRPQRRHQHPEVERLGDDAVQAAAIVSCDVLRGGVARGGDDGHGREPVGLLVLAQRQGCGRPVDVAHAARRPSGGEPMKLGHEI